jgi:hypothetical protein
MCVRAEGPASRRGLKARFNACPVKMKRITLPRREMVELDANEALQAETSKKWLKRDDESIYLGTTGRTEPAGTIRAGMNAFARFFMLLLITPSLASAAAATTTTFCNPPQPRLRPRRAWRNDLPPRRRSLHRPVQQPLLPLQHRLINTDATAVTLYCLSSDPPYAFRIDTINDNGLTRGGSTVTTP